MDNTDNETTNEDLLEEDLSEEAVASVLEQLEKFENNFFTALAGTDRFEIVPTSDGERYLSKEQYSLIRAECAKLGLKIIYKIQLNDSIIYVNSENGKIGYIHDGVH